MNESIQNRNKEYFIANFDIIFKDVPFTDTIKQFKNFLSSNLLTKDQEESLWQFFDVLMHFLINENWYLTDLPGYGYARVSKSLRKDFEKLITNYILHRKNLVNLFVLIDSRHAPQKIDLEFIEWCGENGIPFSIVFTKADKLKPAVAVANVEHYQNELLKTWEDLPETYLTSAEKREGTDEILKFITKTNEFLHKNHVNFD